MHCWNMCRTPLVEVILDELTYNKAIISPFLQVLIQIYLFLLTFAISVHICMPMYTHLCCLMHWKRWGMPQQAFGFTPERMA